MVKEQTVEDKIITQVIKDFPFTWKIIEEHHQTRSVKEIILKALSLKEQEIEKVIESFDFKKYLACRGKQVDSIASGLIKEDLKQALTSKINKEKEKEWKIKKQKQRSS